MNNETLTKPFLKWPGGKRWLIPTLFNLLKGEDINKYYEPFLGGGSIFFALKPRNSILSDINTDLINVYNVTKNNHEKIIKILKTFKTDKNSYYEIRGTNFRNEEKQAAKFLYLNRLCYGGMFRVNKEGKFNVPYGGGRKVSILWENNLLENAAKILKPAIISCEDFETTINKAKEGELVYCDPTYTIAHNNNGFQRYNEKIFSWLDQERLANACFNAFNKGAIVIVSNAAHDSIKKLYSPFKPIVVERYSGVSKLTKGRKNVEEFLFVMKKKGKETAF